MTVYRHTPVLLHESVDLLITDPHGIYVDATLGLGGHSEAILNRITSTGRVIGFDVDPDAIAITKERLKDFTNILFIKNNFKQLKIELTRLNLCPVNGILFDLGLSSLEIDNGEKGFSFMNEGPLDMRMDPSLPLTASDMINHKSRDELKRIISEYGEERHAGIIADKILKVRSQKLFQYTSDLADTVKNIIHGPH
ncbi:MAG TPA: 16S rRNA (cytosine(1402)-N(4))-methyltransferase, partial [Candidatus Marinimicrobia bacterium]|nr:16S rRNA (cytosine(1402)-N(4))-methyltransferase [Candidatus Neomarinimicrobiota bacterium]